MNTRLLFGTILFAFMFLWGCGNNDDEGKDSGELSDNEFTNRWIYSKMKSVYLWNENLPTSPSFNTDPETFFYNILYKYGKTEGDRFSWIEEDQSKSTGTRSLIGNNSLGFDCLPMNYLPNSNAQETSIGMFIVYVYPGSDAEAKGLKRGQVIYQVNNQDVDYDNYSTILSGSTSLNLSIYNNSGTKQTLPTITANENAPSPIFMSKVLEVGNSNTKVGYLMYTAFERGLNDDDFQYDIELMQKISDLNSQGITEFVLDLRYNLGGYLTSAIDLASALYPNRSSDKIFAKEIYNDHFRDSLLTEYKTEDIFNDYFLDKAYGTNTSIPKLNINRLFVIASDYSASASELVIHGLKAHMNVIHIGQTTVGKDKASMTIKSDDSRIKWQWQPLISRLTDVNGDGNYIDGLDPDISVSEWEEGFNMADVYYVENGVTYTAQCPILSPWKKGLQPLGDTSDPMLAEAIAQITGVARIKSTSTKSSAIGNSSRIKVPKLKYKEEKQRIIIDSDRFDHLSK